MLTIHDKTFKSLSASELEEFFPREKVVMEPLATRFVEEDCPLKDFQIHQAIFFNDRYGAQWLLNRNNISKLYLIQVVYVPEFRQLQLKSDVYIMDELVLSLFEEYKEMEWEELTLADMLKIKNKLLCQRLLQNLPEMLKFSFAIYSKDEMREWMNPMKYHFSEVI